MTGRAGFVLLRDMTDDDCDFPPARRQRLRRKLKTWYDGAARNLPWRETSDPYRIWISEIMLQQTTVAAVVPYYQRFFEAFPDLKSLAEAEEHEVLKLWEGLGYYSRARNIWKAARRIAGELEGNFPATVSELEDLPGIGRYTAGAIASFAFDHKAPILEANTLRLYCRLMGYAGDPRSAEGQRTFVEFCGEHFAQRLAGPIQSGLDGIGSGRFALRRIRIAPPVRFPGNAGLLRRERNPSSPAAQNPCF